VNALTLSLGADQGALVIEALAELPFKDVFDLIGRLNRQANEAAAGAAGAVDVQAYRVSVPDLQLIVGALRLLPYHRVHLLMDALEEQVAGMGEA
jgi:23S rRNA maturation mini-RNase III